MFPLSFLCLCYIVFCCCCYFLFWTSQQLIVSLVPIHIPFIYNITNSWKKNHFLLAVTSSSSFYLKLHPSSTSIITFFFNLLHEIFFFPNACSTYACRQICFHKCQSTKGIYSCLKFIYIFFFAFLPGVYSSLFWMEVKWRWWWWWFTFRKSCEKWCSIRDMSYKL